MASGASRPPAPVRELARGLGRELRGGLADLVGLAVPVDCAGCGAPGAALCPQCRSLLAVAPRQVPARRLGPGVPVWSGPLYDGAVARIVVAWKERGRHDVVPLLGAALAAGPLRAALRGLDPAGVVLLVPVPSSRAAVRARGEHHVRRLTLHAAGQLRRGPGCGPSVPTDPVGRTQPARPGAAGLSAVRVADVLRVRARVADQAGLGAAQRRRNLEGALAPRPRIDLGGRACVVVDDVLTTGATVAAAVAALRAGGARVVGACTLSETPLRRGLSARRWED